MAENTMSIADVVALHDDQRIWVGLDNEVIWGPGYDSVVCTNLRESLQDMGTCTFIVRKVYTYAVCIGPFRGATIDDTWCYEHFQDALAALVMWDPMEDREPDGWHRHPRTGRRRPGGDATQEYISE